MRSSCQQPQNAKKHKRVGAKGNGGTYNLFVVIIEFGRFIQAPRSAPLCASD
jgi:hypothetical protein